MCDLFEQALESGEVFNLVENTVIGQCGSKCESMIDEVFALVLESYETELYSYDDLKKVIEAHLESLMDSISDYDYYDYSDEEIF